MTAFMLPENQLSAERAGSQVTLVSGNISSWKYSTYTMRRQHPFKQLTSQETC